MDLTWDDTNDNWYGDLDQRLAVARAVCSDSPVLLLDVCTSALDPKTGSVEKVGVEPDPKRVGPASWNLEYG